MLEMLMGALVMFVGILFGFALAVAIANSRRSDE